MLRAGRLSLTTLLMTLLVAACGGSGGGSNGTPQTPAPPPLSSGPTAQELANAKAAALSATLDPATGTVTLSWTDTFSNASGYRVEEQNGSTWTALETLPGLNGSKSEITWNRTASASKTFRVQAVLSTYDVPLLTATAQQSQVPVALQSTVPTIELDQAEPVAGTVGISISGGGQYDSVRYFADLKLIASSAIAPDYAATWQTATLTTGPHLLVAQLAVAPDSYIEIRRTVQVENPQVAVSLTVDHNGVAHIAKVRASSDFGIQSVSATIDGTSLGSLTAPASDGWYSFTIPAPLDVSGPHTLTAQAADFDGKSASTTLTTTFDNPPRLTIGSPSSGSLVNGTLHLAGTFSSDKPGAVELKVTLGNTPVLTTSASPFSSDYSLTGVPAGNYTLTAIAKDSGGTMTMKSVVVTVTSSQALTYSPIAQIGKTGQLLAVDGTTALYQLPDGSVHRLSGATDTTLQTADLAPNEWRLTNGHAFALGATANSGGSNADVYHWSPGSTAPQSLGTLGERNSLARLRAVHWPWVLASDGIPNNQVSGYTALYVFYNAQTGQTITPTLVDPTLAGSDVDFSVGGSGITLYYGADLSTNAGYNPIGISRWDQATDQSTPIATAALWQINQQTDGTYVAWQTGTPGQNNGPFNLRVLNIAADSQQDLSTTLSDDTKTSLALGQFGLADGLLGWREKSTTSAALKAWDGTTTTTVSPLLSSRLYGVGGGYVLFGEGSKLYVWSASAGRKLVLDVPPGIATLSGHTVYFTNGPEQTLYSLTLN